MKGQDLHLKWSMRPSIIVEKYRCQKLFLGIRSIFPPPEPFSLLNCESCSGEMLISYKWSSIFLFILKKTIWFIVPIEIAFDGDFGSCILFTFRAIEDISPSQLDNANLIFSPIKNKGCYFLCSKDGLSLQKRWKQLGTKLRHHTNLMTPSRAKKFAWWLMFILGKTSIQKKRFLSGIVRFT